MSRGLGDVYKRQTYHLRSTSCGLAEKVFMVQFFVLVFRHPAVIFQFGGAFLMIIHVNVKYFFSFTDFFPSPSIELRFNCATSTFRTCPCKNMVYHSLARNLYTRVLLTLQGESYQPESKIQQPSQRRSEFPSRFQTNRHQQPSRTIPAFRQWHRSGTVGRTTRRTGKFQNRGWKPPRR